MPSYIGRYKMPIWGVIGFPLLVFGSAWFTWAITQDAQYADMLAHPGGPHGWLIAVLPRPVLLAFIGAATVAFAFGTVLMFLAAIKRKIAFVLDADGIRSTNMLTGKTTAMAWGAITTFQRVKSIRLLSGQGLDGRKVTVSLQMMGHDKRAVFAVIGHYRPDMLPYLD